MKVLDIAEFGGPRCTELRPIRWEWVIRPRIGLHFRHRRCELVPAVGVVQSQSNPRQPGRAADCRTQVSICASSSWPS